MLLTIVSFIFVFTVIALVHEWGHMLFSKRAGIRVPEFGIGFGPNLFSWTRNNTLYKINLLPILGYVKIAGMDIEDPEEQEIPEAEKYCNKSVGQKFRALFAGPAMNLLLGFFLFSFVFMIAGVPADISNEISTISPGSNAEKIGLKPGDRLISINGQVFDKAVDAVKRIHQSAGKNLSLGIQRGQKRIYIKAAPEYNERMKIALIGFSLKANQVKVNPLTAFYYGFKETVGLVMLILGLLGRLLVGKLSFGDLAGPVGIAQITGQYAHHGFLSLINFMAFFSINVAVINLLPIPALDGGRIIFVLLEAVRRKPISMEKENQVHHIGLFMLLGLIALLTVNDIIRIFFK